MFKKNKELYCGECTKLNNKDYDLITTYIKSKPGATVMEITTETGISLKSIKCFVEDGSMSYIGSFDNPYEFEVEVTNKGGASWRRTT